MSGFVVSIPVPPSTNSLYANRRSQGGRRCYGRVKTRTYRRWLDLAGKELLAQRRSTKRISGAYRLFLTLPAIRGDADNRLKAASDLIVFMGLVDDDRHCVEFRAVVDHERPKGWAVVAVEAV